jgi:hypothetical protein
MDFVIPELEWFDDSDKFFPPQPETLWLSTLTRKQKVLQLADPKRLPVLRVEEISKRFGGLTVLNEVDFSSLNRISMNRAA